MLIMLIFMVSSIFATDKDLWVVESGDDELYIGYSILDTPAYDFIQQGTNPQTSGGSASGEAGSSKLNLNLDLIVIDDRYEGGDDVFSTLFLEIPQQYLSQGGYFEYYLIGPDGTQYDLKTIKIEDNNDKLLSYELPLDAQNGKWEMKGVLKINGYQDLGVSDTFKVQNYTLFIWYLLAIIVFTSMALMIYLRKRNNNYI